MTSTSVELQVESTGIKAATDSVTALALRLPVLTHWLHTLAEAYAHTHKQIQATHCLSSLHPGPALAVTRCHPKSITIVYVLILFLSLGVTTHGTHKKTHYPGLGLANGSL